MRLLAKVEAFAKHIASTYPRLDYLINNAAQTIRRPPVFYEHLLKLEQAEMPAQLKAIQLPFEAAPPAPMLGAPQPSSAPSLLPTSPQGGSLVAQPSLDDEEKALSLGALSSLPHDPPALTQVPLIPEDFERNEEHFPPGAMDKDGQQVDSRIVNSWVLHLFFLFLPSSYQLTQPLRGPPPW